MTTTGPNTLSEIHKALEDKMIEVLAVLEGRYKKPMPLPSISVQPRIGLKGGYAVLKENKVVINQDMCALRWDFVRDECLPHEICHLVAPLIYNRWLHGVDRNEGWSHGRAWKECMIALGLKPDRTFDTDDELIQNLSIRKVSRPYVYGCPCGKTFKLTAILHNRIQSGRGRRCNRCKRAIVFKGTETSA